LIHFCLLLPRVEYVDCWVEAVKCLPSWYLWSQGAELFSCWWYIYSGGTWCWCTPLAFLCAVCFSPIYWCLGMYFSTLCLLIVWRSAYIVYCRHLHYSASCCVPTWSIVVKVWILIQVSFLFPELWPVQGFVLLLHLKDICPDPFQVWNLMLRCLICPGAMLAFHVAAHFLQYTKDSWLTFESLEEDCQKYSKYHIVASDVLMYFEMRLVVLYVCHGLTCLETKL
jgi:hypothetical protein